MNRDYFRRAKAKCKGLKMSPRATWQMCRVLAESEWTGPLSDEELNLSRLWYATHRPKVYFHGGAAELGVGDVLLPAKYTGRDPRGFGNIVPDRREWVYMTGCKKMAACFAEQCAGNLFVVEPEGDVFMDPTELRTVQTMSHVMGTPITPKVIVSIDNESWVCKSARITGIHARFWGWEGDQLLAGTMSPSVA